MTWWQAALGWIGSFFKYHAPQKADFEAVQAMHAKLDAAMKQRIDDMAKEFSEEMERVQQRHTANEERYVKRIDSLEASEASCRERLSDAMTQLAETKGQLIEVKAELQG